MQKYERRKYLMPQLLFTPKLFGYFNVWSKWYTSIIDVPSITQIKRDRASKFLEHPFDAASYLVEYYWRIKITYKDVNKGNK